MNKIPEVVKLIYLMLKTRCFNVKYSIAFVLLLLLVNISCKEPIEGCRDIAATNYDVSADEPCENDCCTYPRLSLSIAHRYMDSLSFSFDSIYVDDGNNMAVQFQQMIFYLSNFRLTMASDSFETIETIDLDIIGGETATFKDDFTLVSRSISSFSYDIGEIRGLGTFDTLKFTVGLAGDAAFVDAETVEEGHPLALNTDTLWTSTEGYVFNRLTVVPDTMNNDPLVSRQFDIRGNENLVEISLAYPIEVNRGIDLSIPLKIDYQIWFSGIDFVNNIDSYIANKIVENTANAFSINE